MPGPTSTSASEVSGRLAVTLGDPRGIGPEVAARAGRAFRDERPDVDLVFFGDPAGEDLPGEVRTTGAFDGSPASAGRVSAGAIEAAVDAIRDGGCSALVTAPIQKPALRAAGIDHPGHTEFLQALTGVARVGMLMAAETTPLGGPLRVLLATTHLALRDVPGRLDPALLIGQTELLHDALRTGWGIAAPRIALCAFNPHAGDEGLFGDEEARVYAPAVARLRADGRDVSNPLPADTVFVRAIRGEFDAVVAPYHDVGMAAFKTAGFGRGVNVTLGLPFPRTSPDHGTAFDVAGRGIADPGSMLEALRLAARLAPDPASRAL